VCRHFSTLDARGAYNLMRMAAASEELTTFKCEFGTFAYRVMPFGLHSAGASFQRWINSIFADLIGVSVIIYLDDILVFTRTKEEHERLLHEIFRRMRQHGLYAAPQKCKLHQKSVEFLGFIVSSQGVQANPKKVETIAKWAVPKTWRVASLPRLCWLLPSLHRALLEHDCPAQRHAEEGPRV